MPAVPKCSAGYFAAPDMDLIDLFIGAEGTLGVIVDATLRVLPAPPAIAALVPRADRIEASGLALVADLRARAAPTWRRAIRTASTSPPIESSGSPLSGAPARGRQRQARSRSARRTAPRCCSIIQVELPPGTTAATPSTRLPPPGTAARPTRRSRVLRTASDVTALFDRPRDRVAWRSPPPRQMLAFREARRSPSTSASARPALGIRASTRRRPT